MNKQTEKKTSAQMVEAIFALDLDPIKFKLMDKKEGHGWTREEADRHELEYRRFLALTAKFPDDVITPDTNVDRFWHGHILDTMKYAEDCQHVFGYFLHHFPYFGMRDEDDAANLADASANTRRLYAQEFGNAGAADAAYCARVADKASASYCARVASEAAAGQSSSYCARVADKAAYCAAPTSSYCARVADKAEASGQSASYCARVADQADATSGQAAYCAAPSTSYCTRVADKADDGAQAASYCARVASKADAYCAATNAAYYGTVLGKGRPKLESTAV